MANSCETLTPSKGFFDDISSRLSLPVDSIEQAKEMFKELNLPLNPRLMTRCCIYAVSSECIPAHKLVGGESLPAFLEVLKAVIPLTEHSGKLRFLLKKLRFQVGLHSKFQDIIKQLHIDGSLLHIQEVSNFAWLLFICAKAGVQKWFECGYILASTISAVVSRLPSTVRFNSDSLTEVLTRILKIQPDQLLAYSSKTELFIDNLVRDNVLDPGLMHPTCVHKNLKNLKELYLSSLPDDMMDERDFIKNYIKPSHLFSPYRRRDIGDSHVRLLNWNEEPPIQNKEKSPSAFEGLLTPMTIAMEITHWFYNIVETQTPGDLPIALNKLEALFKENGIGLSASADSFLADNFENVDCTFERSSKTTEVSILYQAFCQQTLPSKGLFACALESFLYVHEITSVTLEDVIEISEVNPVELYSSIASLITKDLPLPLKWHFEEISEIIVVSLAWQSKKFIEETALEFKESREINSFIQKALGYASKRLADLAFRIGLDNHLREKSWETLKFVFLKKPELLWKRHLDQLILCSTYGSCRSSNVSFVKIAKKYLEMNPDQSIVRRVLVRDEVYEDIIGFYNSVFVPSMLEWFNQLVSGNENIFQGIRFPQPHFVQTLIRSPLKPTHVSRRTHSYVGISSLPRSSFLKESAPRSPNIHEDYQPCSVPVLKKNY